MRQFNNFVNKKIKYYFIHPHKEVHVDILDLEIISDTFAFPIIMSPVYDVDEYSSLFDYLSIGGKIVTAPSTDFKFNNYVMRYNKLLDDMVDYD